jgi:hypothetical protein
MAIRYDPQHEPIPCSGDEHLIGVPGREPRTDWEQYSAARTAFLATLRRDSMAHWLARSVDEILSATEAPSAQTANDRRDAGTSSR